MNKRATKKLFKKAIKRSNEPVKDVRARYKKAGKTFRKMANWI